MGRGLMVGVGAILVVLVGAPVLHSAQPARIAYTGKNALYTANSDGTNRVLVVRGVADNGTFSWSPDGTKIAFSGGHQRPHAVFVVNEDGSGLQRLTTTARDRPSDGAENPSWSPDGTEIVFDAATNETTGPVQIFVMNADGSARRQLTRGPGYKWIPVWSPDGATVLYEQWVGPSTPGNPPQSGQLDLISITLDGVQKTIARVHSERDHCACAVWSPDGTKIAYEAAQASGKPDIYVMNADGSGRTRLTTDPARDENPDWSPDGTQIAFYSERAGDAEIYVMNADGSKQHRVTHDPWYDGAVRWKPAP